MKIGRPLISSWTLKGAKGSSLIRAMFERAAQLEKIKGKENIFNFSLGNPSINPPDSVRRKIIELAQNDAPGRHGYMTNAGYPDVRAKIADYLNEKHQLDVLLTQNHVVMTCGASAALNIIFKTILNPGDQVIVPSPYFSEYKFYVGGHQGHIVPVPTGSNFRLDTDNIQKAINLKTKAILINSPNNPTGMIYSEKSLKDLADIISQKETEYGHDILLVTDEPYSGIIYDGLKLPATLKIFPHCIMATSHSKDLGLAGERIGYLAISPRISEASRLFDGIVFNGRTLGFINAPAFWQKAVADSQGEVSGLEEYCARRNILYDNLSAMGYQVIKPLGTFYMMMKSPIEDDAKFAEMALQHGIVMVPASAFNAPGYLRLSFSGITREQIIRSLSRFRELAKG